MLKHAVFLMFVLALPITASAGQQGSCAGSPPQAVLKLPAPLSQWGTVVCTPYGHIISNHDGWIWSRPGAYSPVFVPSQMVRSNPKPLGNASYFTKIEFVPVSLSNKAAIDALAELNKHFDPEVASNAYRLYVTGSLGRSLVIYFFRLGNSIWGIWCDKDGANCSSSSAFMVLDMRKGS